MRSVLLDNSFVTRLLKKDDEFHHQVIKYYLHFLNTGVVMYLSTIVVSEYAVADDPDHLLDLNNFQLLEFDYMDAKTAGGLFKKMLKDKHGARTVVINDIKLLAQIKNRGIDAFITKDQQLLNKVASLKDELNFTAINLSVPLNQFLGRLF